MLSEQDQAALRVLQKSTLHTSTVKRASDDIKSSVFYKNNWDTLLMTAPNCLELLGNCHLVASTPLAQQTTLTAPINGFKYLKGCVFYSPHQS